MPAVKFQNRNIFYQNRGDGFPIVLVHGFGEDSSVWDKMLEKMEGERVITMDLPGIGKSDLAKEDSVECYAESIKAILDELKIKKCILIGHSMGGYVTLAFADMFPEYLSGFGLFHSHPFADSEETKKNREKSIAFIQTNGPIHYVKQLIPKLFPSGYVSSNRFIIDQQIFKASKFSAEGIISGQRLMVARPDRSEVLKNSLVPVLCLIGDKDELIPMEKNIEQTFMAPIADIHILPGIGHMGMLETPGKTAKIIRQFSDFCQSQ